MWSNEAESVMRKAGWFVGRKETRLAEDWRLKIAGDGFCVHDAAVAVWEEFGGLSARASGAGLECSRGDFSIDPMRATGESDRFRAFSHAVAGGFSPVGEVFDGRAFFATDARGGMYYLGDELFFCATDIRTAIDAVLMGRRCHLVDVNPIW